MVHQDYEQNLPVFGYLDESIVEAIRASNPDLAARPSTMQARPPGYDNAQFLAELVALAGQCGFTSATISQDVPHGQVVNIQLDDQGKRYLYISFFVDDTAQANATLAEQYERGATTDAPYISWFADEEETPQGTTARNVEEERDYWTDDAEKQVQRMDIGIGGDAVGYLAKSGYRSDDEA